MKEKHYIFFRRRDKLIYPVYHENGLAMKEFDGYDDAAEFAEQTLLMSKGELIKYHIRSFSELTR